MIVSVVAAGAAQDADVPSRQARTVRNILRMMRSLKIIPGKNLHRAQTGFLLGTFRAANSNNRDRESEK